MIRFHAGKIRRHDDRSCDLELVTVPVQDQESGQWRHVLKGAGSMIGLTPDLGLWRFDEQIEDPIERDFIDGQDPSVPDMQFKADHLLPWIQPVRK